MKFLFFFLILIFNFFIFADQTKPTVIITTFSPFGSSQENWSQNIADRVRQILKTDNQQTPINLVICNLNVSYAKAFNEALNCLSQISDNPQLVLSLGEAACDLRLETAAINFISSSTKDEDGEVRKGEKIDSLASKKIPFNSLVQKMYCSLESKSRSQVLVSASPGGYVCNHLAYQLGHFLMKKNVPYSFIHVPNSSCKKSLIEDSSQSISSMITNTIPFLSKNHGPSQMLCEKLPTEISQIKNFKEIMGAYKPDLDRRCQKEFLRKLKTKLAQWEPKNSTY